MLTIETSTNFKGFGENAKTLNSIGQPVPSGEYYFSQNMHKSLFGIVPGWVITSNFTALDTGQWFTQAKWNDPNPNTYTFKIGTAGYIERTPLVGSWETIYSSGSTCNGLIADQKNRLLYPGARYLGMADGTAAAVNYKTGTIAVTNGSTAVVGTGTTFTAGMVGKQIIINGTTVKTVSAFTDVTHITLNTAYTGTTASTLPYTIATGWTDNWKDFGTDISATTSYVPTETYEDWVLFGRGNVIAALNTTDDTFNVNAFNLPAGYIIRSIKAGATGVLIAATFNQRSVLVLWDTYKIRSEAPWIWIEQQVQSIAQYKGEWLVTCGGGIFHTNGYTIESVARPVDTREGGQNFSVVPQGTMVIGNNLLIANNSGAMTRSRAGIYILNLNTNLWEYVTVASGKELGVTMGALFNDSTFNIYIGYDTTLGSLLNGRPNSAFHITEPLGASINGKTASFIKLDLGFYAYDVSPSTGTVDITISLYNFKRPIWLRGQTSQVSTQLNQLKVDGTINPPTANAAAIGDEVHMIEGINAGQTRHVTGITGAGTTNMVITLDSNLSNLTEQFINFNIQPFRVIVKKTISSAANLKELFFPVKDSIAGKKFMVKVLFENMAFTPELQGVSLIYDDLQTL